MASPASTTTDRFPVKLRHYHPERALAGTLSDALRECARVTTGGGDTFWFPPGREDGDWWVAEDAADELAAPPPDTRRLATRLLVDGVTVGTLGVTVGPAAAGIADRTVTLLRAIGQVGRGLFRLARRSTQHDHLFALVRQTVRCADDPRTMERVVGEMPAAPDSCHCTLFLRVRRGGRSYLVPGPSSCGELSAASKSGRRYYQWDSADGLTGYVAARNQEVVLSNVADAAERRAVSPDLSWRKVLAEVAGSQSTAVMAFPVTAPADPAEVIGVVRVYRDTVSVRTRYSEDEVQTFRLFAGLLGKPVAAFLARAGLVDDPYPARSTGKARPVPEPHLALRDGERRRLRRLDSGGWSTAPSHASPRCSRRVRLAVTGRCCPAVKRLSEPRGRDTHPAAR